MTERGALLWHHARPLAHAPYAIVQGTRPTDALEAPSCASGRPCDWGDEWHLALGDEIAYGWLAERVGFWPIFLAVGGSDDDRQITGYSIQWQRPCDARLRADQSCVNKVLFAFAGEPEGIAYVDYDWWHCALNEAVNMRGRHAAVLRGPEPPIDVTRYEERMILKRSWSRSRWLTKAAADAGRVQAVVPRLDLRAADEIWCRNQPTRRELIRRGFGAERVRVRRLAGPLTERPRAPRH